MLWAAWQLPAALGPSSSPGFPPGLPFLARCCHLGAKGIPCLSQCSSSHPWCSSQLGFQAPGGGSAPSSDLLRSPWLAPSSLLLALGRGRVVRMVLSLRSTTLCGPAGGSGGGQQLQELQSISSESSPNHLRPLSLCHLLPRGLQLPNSCCLRTSRSHGVGWRHLPV